MKSLRHGMLRSSVLVAFLSVILTGCNVFGSFYDDVTSDDPAVLREDAQFALQNGDTEKAVELLEIAYEIDPENPVIQVELSSALYQNEGIDLLTLKDLAQFIGEEADGSNGESTAGKHNPLTCNFAELASENNILRFEDADAYIELFNAQDVLQRTDSLLSTAMADGIGELDPNLLSNSYLMRAISSVATAVIDIQEKAHEAEAVLYRLDSSSIGYCASSQEALDDLQHYIVCEKVPALTQAVSDLSLRNSLLGLDNDEVIDAIDDAREGITDAIDSTCSSTS